VTSARPVESIDAGTGTSSRRGTVGEVTGGTVPVGLGVEVETDAPDVVVEELRADWSDPLLHAPQIATNAKSDK